MRLNLQAVIHTPRSQPALCLSRWICPSWTFYGERPMPRSPSRCSGVVRNMAGRPGAGGRRRPTMLDLACDRCLKPFRREMRAAVSTLLAETLEDEENDAIVLLENGEVDLDELFTTALVLAMDTKHLCSEDCKGLCPRCGADLNEGPCGCKPEVDPRLAALAQLLDKETESFLPGQGMNLRRCHNGSP